MNLSVIPNLWKNNKECPNCEKEIEDPEDFRCCEFGNSYCSNDCANEYVNNNFTEESSHAVKWKLVDFPQCAICDYSEQYQDNTFICCHCYDEERNPEPSKLCDELKIGKYYLAGFFELILEEIKQIEKRIEKIENHINLEE